MTRSSGPSTPDGFQRRNARLIVLGQTMSKLGDVVANAKTVLTWLMGVVGAPPAMTALLVPIRESGSMLPQAFAAGFIKHFPRRKSIYAAGAAGQTASLAAMGCAAFFLRGEGAGVAVLLALVFFSLARCLCSIASKDVLGKTVPKGTRGRVTGTAASVSGLLGLVVALWVLFGVDRTASQQTYAWLIFAGASLYLLAAAAILFVAEEPSETDGDDRAADLNGRLRLAWSDPVLRTFIVTRTLLLGSALASPYFVILSQQHGLSLQSLAAFVLAGGLASALSSMLWGRLSDHSSRLAMSVGGAIAGVVGAIGVAVAAWIPDLAGAVWTWPLLFFLLNLGYAGVRIGRKTYVVDAASGSRRTDYVAVSNTLIAVTILVLGAAGSALQAIHDTLPLAFFSVLCLAGAGLALKLRSMDD